MIDKKILKEHWCAVSIVSTLLILAISAAISIGIGIKTVSIAVVIPNKEDDHNQNIIRSLEIYAERINKYGEIKDKKLKFKFFYDHSDIKTAKKIAHEIVDDGSFSAVIGHFDANTTKAAIPIYHESKIVQIDPVSNMKFRDKYKQSDYFFQMSPTPESYGIYMAYYTKYVLKRTEAFIIKSEREIDRDLITSFKSKFHLIGGKTHSIRLKHIKLSEISNVLKIICQIIKLSKETETKILVLATSMKNSSNLVQSLKHNLNMPIISTIPSIVGNYRHNGYKLDRFYAITLNIPDNFPSHLALVRKDYENRYENDKISHAAIKSVLSATFIVEGISKSNFSDQSDLKSIIKMNKWFDHKNQVSAANLTAGIYRGKNLVTAPIKPTLFNEDSIFIDEKNIRNIISIGNRKLYTTNVVYTDVSMNKISDIDLENFTYKLDFFLWFRYQDGLKEAENIEFLNTLKFENLSNALEKKVSDRPDRSMSATLVEESKFGDEVYKRYRVIGYFKTSNPKNYALGQQNLYVKFRNKNLNKYKIVYVSDYSNNNMGINSLETLEDSDINDLKFNVIDNQNLTLNYAFSYTDESNKTNLGNPSRDSESNKFSQFVAEYRVEPTSWSFRGIISLINYQISGRKDQIDLSLMILLLSLACVIYIFTLFGKSREFFEGDSNSWWLIQLCVVLFILLFGELVASQYLYNLKYSSWGRSHQDIIDNLTHYTVEIVSILWWFTPAYYLTSAIDQFLWKTVKVRTGAEIPNVLKLAITILVYSLALFGVMAYVLKVTVTGLAATSGFIAILIAVASKIDLSNVLAGLGISFSNVFKIGDWVKINGIEGKVVEMTPRSTKILTFESSIVSIPNTSVSGSTIENFNRPNLPYRLIIHLETVPIYKFEWVEKILLDAVISTHEILDNPKPFVIFKGQGDSCQIYEVAFFIEDYSKRAVLWQATWRRIWRHLEQANIKLATPQREIFMLKDEEVDTESYISIINSSLDLSDFSKEAKERMAESSALKEYKANDVIFDQNQRMGLNKDSLLLVVEGVISVLDQDKEIRFGSSQVIRNMDRLLVDQKLISKTPSRVLIINQESI